MNVISLLLTVTALLPSPPGIWQWPLRPDPRVIRAFAPPPAPWLAGHRGVDLAAAPGQEVYAAGPGAISFAGRVAGVGVVAVLHDPAVPFRTTYLPVIPSVRVGTRVRAGTGIGRVQAGWPHCGPVTCLHWALIRGRSYEDPLRLVRPTTLRLLPVWPRHIPENPMNLTFFPARDDATTPTALLLALMTGFVLGGLRPLWQDGLRPLPRGHHRRLPTDVIDLAAERHRRRTTPPQNKTPA